MSKTTATVLLLVVAMLGLAASPPTWMRDEVRRHEHKRDAMLGRTLMLPSSPLTGGFECDDDPESEDYGLAAGLMACSGIDLLSYIPTEVFMGDTSLLRANNLQPKEGSDMWGWTDPEDGREYVIIGKTNGVAFFDISDPLFPVHVGSIDNTSAVQLLWHDIKVYEDHAFIVSESNGHGMQVFDLTRLRPDARPADGSVQQFLPDSVYPLANAAHNLAINEETGFAYIVGGNSGIVVTDQCRSGLHMVDISTPTAPVFAGCYLLDGGAGQARQAGMNNTPTVAGVRSTSAYAHDAQCVVYRGPDEDYQGREICFNYAEDRVVIVDVTNKALPLTIASVSYDHATYTHQGWLTEDQTHILVNDELDEEDNDNITTTRTIIFDVSDLDAPGQPMIHDHGYKSIDHNLYTHQGAVYQSHYGAGLRVSDLRSVADGVLHEVAYFDVHPDDDRTEGGSTTFHGTWSNYPYFESGVVAISGYEGLWLVRVDADVLAAIQG